ncbi:MAG: RidA family protein [Gammaproteobacteria bacterium]
MTAIYTEHAPRAIGPYSQAIKHGNTVYFAGQIPLDPITMQIVSDDIVMQTEQVLRNIQAVAIAAGGGFEHIVKLTIFLTDLNDFALVNEVMARHFQEPYPARSTVQVVALPKKAKIEVEAVMGL